MTTTVAPVIANAAVVTTLRAANESAKTADKLAREAAVAANAADYLDEANCGIRLDSILTLYIGELTHKNVKDSFSAALAILVADKPVRVEASAKTENANGTLTFKAPEVLEPTGNEAPTEGKAITTLEAGDAVRKLAADVMKKAATTARQAIGRGRSEGGGRKSTKAPERAPFMDELVAVLRDEGLRASMFAVISTAAKSDSVVLERCAEVCRNAGYEVARPKAKATKPTATK